MCRIVKSIFVNLFYSSFKANIWPAFGKIWLTFTSIEEGGGGEPSKVWRALHLTITMPRFLISSPYIRNTSKQRAD